MEDHRQRFHTYQLRDCISMKIALIGYGKMGRLIEQIALSRGHMITAKISPSLKTKITAQALAAAEVCIDFSHPECVLNNIEQLCHLKKSVVVGTTGWYDNLDQVKNLVQEYSIGLLYAPNFSIGIHLFLQMIIQSAQLIASFPEYDIGITEAHHRHKVDSPSGTAKLIASHLQQNHSKKEECPISSFRCGSIPGTHTVYFDSPVDSITLTHQAHNREGFALGSVQAAEWLIGKKGIFTLNDLFPGPQ